MMVGITTIAAEGAAPVEARISITTRVSRKSLLGPSCCSYIYLMSQSQTLTWM
jgi:hypothetical protein